MSQGVVAACAHLDHRSVVCPERDGGVALAQRGAVLRRLDVTTPPPPTWNVQIPKIIRFWRVVSATVGGASDRGVTRGDGAAATAATVAAGGLGVQGCVRDTRRLVSAHRAFDTLSAGNVAS